jgi:ornithine cyclodeaminase/alanine dehydrogenase-like protein (mu-crystallin family)
MALLLSNEDVRDLVEPQECVAVLEEAYRAFGREEAATRLRTHTYGSVQGDGRFYCLKTMDGVYPARNVAALRLTSDLLATPLVGGMKRLVKTPSVGGRQWVGLVLLFAMDSGELLAILHDAYLQTVRVGATYALAAKYLARPDARVMGLFGSGWQAGPQVLAHCAVRALDEVRVFSPTREHRERFAAAMQRRTGVNVHAVESPDAVCPGADIVMAATNAMEPVIHGAALEPGMHLGAIKGEIDAAVLARTDLVVTNDHAGEASFAPGGRLPEHLVPDGTDPREIPSLAEIVAGLHSGRTEPSQITFFNGRTGIGLQFAAVGALALDRARRAGRGHELPSEWFLQDRTGGLDPHWDEAPRAADLAAPPSY